VRAPTKSAAGTAAPLPRRADPLRLTCDLAPCLPVRARARDQLAARALPALLRTACVDASQTLRCPRAGPSSSVPPPPAAGPPAGSAAAAWPTALGLPAAQQPPAASSGGQHVQQRRGLAAVAAPAQPSHSSGGGGWPSPQGAQLLPASVQRRCYRWGARAPAQPLLASAALHHHAPTPATSPASGLQVAAASSSAEPQQEAPISGNKKRSLRLETDRSVDAKAAAGQEPSKRQLHCCSWPLTQLPPGCRPDAAEAMARELCALMGDSCTATQAQVERKLKSFPSLLTLPAATLTQRISQLADKLEREPGELLQSYIHQPALLTRTAETLLGRVNELLAWAGPGNRQLVLRGAAVNPAMLARCALLGFAGSRKERKPACLDKCRC
jgi:hypothetical protein